MHTPTFLIPFAVLFLGCATSDTTEPSIGGGGGKADGTGGEILNCNNGAMKLEPSAQYGNRWVATVYDQGVIDWFVAQSETFYTTTVEYSGQTSTATVLRNLPWMVSVEGDGTDRKMIVRDL